MWEAIAAFLAVLLVLLKRHNSKEEEAVKKENEALENIEKANRDIGSGNVADFSRSIDDVIDAINAGERLRRKITSSPVGGSNSEPKK